GWAWVDGLAVIFSGCVFEVQHFVSLVRICFGCLSGRCCRIAVASKLAPTWVVRRLHFYWQASHSGSSMAQARGATGAAGASSGPACGCGVQLPPWVGAATGSD